MLYCVWNHAKWSCQQPAKFVKLFPQLLKQTSLLPTDWLVTYWCCQGHTIAQAVSCQLPTAVAWVRSQVRSCGICGGQSGTGAGFRRALRFPLPILIPPTTPHSSSIIWGWYNGPNIGRHTKWTESHPTPRNYWCCLNCKCYFLFCVMMLT
jgi:hypothetical protein